MAAITNTPPQKQTPTTTSQGHKEVRKSIKAKQTAVKINNQQKELKKKVAKNVSGTSTELDDLEKKSKKKIEKFTEKLKDSPKNFKTASKNQLQELVETFLVSIRQKSNEGKNLNTNSLTVKNAEKEIEDLKKKIKNTPAGPGRTKLEEEEERATKELRKLQLNTFSTNFEQSAIASLKNAMIQTANRTKEEVKKIILTEYVRALGCSQEQTYQSGDIYIKVRNIDIFGKTLQNDPNTSPGKYLYEIKPFTPRSIPRSFNRELWKRIQDEGKSYSVEYGLSYVGASGQELFDIIYIKDPFPNMIGEYYRVSLKEKQNGNTVTEFFSDYLNSIDVLNFNELFTNVMNLLVGSVDMKKLIGYDDLRSQSNFEKILQRILGLCFDNRQEIDVSGSGKLDSSDQIDDSFFVLSDEDVLEIENKVKNVQEKVIQYKDCGTLYLPVDVDGSLSLLDDFLYEDIDASQADAVAQNMLNKLSNNQDWIINFPQFGKLEDVINKEFINLLPTAVINSILSPKHLFPLFVMGKSLQKTYLDNLETPEDFIQEFRKMVINVASKIQSIFVKALVEAIKANLKILMREIITDTVTEVLTNRQKLNLIALNAALTAIKGVQDYRRCKSVLDELQRIVSLTSALRKGLKARGDKVPAYVNYISAASKTGMASLGMLTRIIEKMDDTGIPTGDLPSGSPNLGLIMMKNVTDSILEEVIENGKAQVTITTIEAGLIAAGAPTPITLDGNLL